MTASADFGQTLVGGWLGNNTQQLLGLGFEVFRLPLQFLAALTDGVSDLDIAFGQS